ncbi:tetratricopeptide repeat protein [Borreliella tanukii]|uniref:tetratricopeptide repeat protein n=1 Tax=Borreliella tanukii TaxID=56146 RepID=UPI00264A3CC2|nr:tetratricopeptide repeat protein [Borreliella tanukii]WKC79725.1 tetratricopeptide repeat protein [Borreliella tanukii]WKC80646.1 tetratricopeptide repeat protein [Borreliella tanukii]WKC81561.1 tetratricopeptide repeat protein [Borreliella tanukii]WKC82476.1 tetratricopeptide repeat protein [Borreliella tanukii]
MKKLTLLSLILISCYTINLEKLTKETPYEVYLREAQKAINVNDYNSALKAYEKMIQNFAHNPNVVATGKYEIAFIYYTINKTEKAKKIFEELIENKMEMPKWIKPLAKKILNKIENNNLKK